jgi:phosphoribosylaminoimidazole-succinocarboxamide synthase
MLDSFLRQVTKDSYGPISFHNKTALPAVVHKFQDAFSVQGWGRMPDPILGRGKVNAFLFSKFNMAVQSEAAWKLFLKSPYALAFRKAGASIQQSGNLSSMLNELTDTFPMANNFIGAINEQQFKAIDQKTSLSPRELMPEDAFSGTPEQAPLVYPVCEFISEEKVPVSQVMGRAVWNHSVFKEQVGAKPLPFEFLCHYKLTESSLKRLKVDSVSLPKTASLQTLQAGTTWDFPVVELVLAQNPFEKRVGLSEAIWMTGMAPEALQKTMLTAAWVSAFMRNRLKKLELDSIKIRFALLADGTLMLNDNFTLDDLHLERDGHLLHTDSSMDFYQKTSWLESVMHARAQAETFGMPEWKRLIAEPAPFLDPKVKSKLEADQQELLKCLSE